MAAPIWLTPAGNLGTIPEMEFYEIPLDAYNSAGGELTYTLLAGSLPQGLEVYSNGTISGIPVNGEIQGVPSAVERVTTSTFTVRVRNGENLVADRTFSLTVAGIDPPIQVPSAGLLGTFVDGDYVDIQLGVILSNTLLTATFSLLEGELPTGLTLTSDGRIYGYITPTPSIETFGPVGPIWAEARLANDPPAFSYGPSFDWTNPDYTQYNVPFDQESFDVTSINISKNYGFTIQVSDGVNVDADHYTIYVYSRTSLTADNTDITADSDISALTADIDTLYNPVLLTEEGTIASLRQNTNFAFRFDAEDFDSDLLTYEIVSGSLPTGLILNSTSGWITGIVPYGSLGTVEYTFELRVFKTGYPSYASESKEFTIRLLGQVDNDVIWNTAADLGSIFNGAISELSVSASTPSGRFLTYSLSSIGALPAGLELLGDGTISGRVSFDTFTVDNNLLTFDHDSTTFDQTYTFEVSVTDAANLVSGSKEFTIRVVQRDKVPYENLYVQILPNRLQRNIYNSIVSNSDIIPPNYLYRPNDPWFGKNTLRRMLFQTGLSPDRVADYIAALEKNHYWKTLNFGDIKVARALDDNFETIYEVVYFELIDSLVNSDGLGPDLAITWPTNTQNISTVYPNSFPNMATRVADSVGYQNRSILPTWMSSRQTNGLVLGFTRALVLAYAKPGFGEEIAYRVRQVADEFKLIDFTIDRYEWDSSLSDNFLKYPGSGSGTITISTASNSCVGTGTLFTTELLAGMTVYVANVAVGNIQSITNNTVLSFTTNAASNVSGQAYTFSTNMFAINNFVNGTGNIVANTQSNIVVGLSTTINGAGVISGNTSTINVTGIGTAFATELRVGRKIYYGVNAIGTIASIKSNTLLTLTEVSSLNYSNVSFTADGVTTLFASEIIVNDTLVANTGSGNVILGTVKSITNDNSLILHANSTANVSDLEFGHTVHTEYSVPVSGDTYLKFPKTNILTNVTS